MRLYRRNLILLALAVAAVTLQASFTSYAESSQVSAENELQPQALATARVYELKKTDPNLTGAGVSVAVICRSITYIDGQPQNDYQPDITHNCLKSAQFTFHDEKKQPPDISPHSTAICSILFGQDTNAYEPNLGGFNYEAAIPDANAQIYEFWHFLTDKVFLQRKPDVDIITAAVGNHSQQWWTRGIESLAEKYGIIIVAGIGNGSKAFDPPLYPAAGSNVIGVGVVDSANTKNITTNLSHFSLAHPEHSSFGPTSDARCKPDIVAPGNCLAAVVNEPNLYEPTGNWTSFATPVVTGTIGMLVQKAKQDPNLSQALSPEGGNCVMKAVLMNSADKLPFWHKGHLTKDDDRTSPLDYIQGAGMVNALAAYKQLTAGQASPGNVTKTGWDLNRLEENQALQNIYRITIPDANQKNLTATVVWNRHFNDSYPFEPATQKDANIRLELWAVNPDEPAKDYLLDYSDSAADNVEHIYCSLEPNYSTYEIVVSYSNIDDPLQTLPPQRYGLAWNVSKKQNNDNILLYDLNTDGIVDKLDYSTLLENWINSVNIPAFYFIGDINTDSSFDVNDINLLTEQMGRKADWYEE